MPEASLRPATVTSYRRSGVGPASSLRRLIPGLPDIDNLLDPDVYVSLYSRAFEVMTMRIAILPGSECFGANLAFSRSDRIAGCEACRP